MAELHGLSTISHKVGANPDQVIYLIFDRGALLTLRQKPPEVNLWTAKDYNHDKAEISQIRGHFHRKGLRTRSCESQ